MKNKFEILEQPNDKEDRNEVDGPFRWFQTHRKFTYPIRTMVSFNNNDNNIIIAV